jgi:uncharacterized protein
MKVLVHALRFYSVLMSLALGWIYFQHRLRWDLFFRADPKKFGMDLSVGLVAASSIIGLSLFASKNFLWAQLLGDEFAKIVVPLHFWEIAAVALLSGIVEETFFRGAIQPVLGLIPTSLLFGIAHFVPRKQLLPWSACAVLAGFVMGCLFELTHNLFPAILAHSATNFVLILILNRRRTVQPA